MEPSLTSLTLVLQHRKLRHGGAKELAPGPRARTVHRPAGSASVLRCNDFRANWGWMLRMKSSTMLHNKTGDQEGGKKKKDVSPKTKCISKILLGLLVQDVVKFHKKHNATPLHQKEPAGASLWESSSAVRRFFLCRLQILFQGCESGLEMLCH